jgi:Trehalose receptor
MVKATRLRNPLSDIEFLSTVNLVFLTCAVSSSVLFFVLAQKWDTIIDTWQRHEAVFFKSPYTIYKRSLKRWIRGVGGSILGAALGNTWKKSVSKGSSPSALFS